MTVSGNEYSRAVSLTYDGPQCEDRLAELNAAGLRGTIFLSAEELVSDPRPWRSANELGHEIGAFPLRGAADEFGNLLNWTLAAVREEVEACQSLHAELLEGRAACAALDGDRLLCLSDSAHRSPIRYRQVFEEAFDLIRTSSDTSDSDLDPKALPSCRVDRFDLAESLIRRFLDAASPRWLILRLTNCPAADHKLLLAYLGGIGGSTLIAPMQEAAAWIGLIDPAKR